MPFYFFRLKYFFGFVFYEFYGSSGYFTIGIFNLLGKRKDAEENKKPKEQNYKFKTRHDKSIPLKSPSRKAMPVPCQKQCLSNGQGCATFPLLAGQGYAGFPLLAGQASGASV